MEGIKCRQISVNIAKNGSKPYNFDFRGLKRHKNRHHVICTSKNASMLHTGWQDMQNC